MANNLRENLLETPVIGKSSLHFGLFSARARIQSKIDLKGKVQLKNLKQIFQVRQVYDLFVANIIFYTTYFSLEILVQIHVKCYFMNIKTGMNGIDFLLIAHYFLYRYKS